MARAQAARQECVALAHLRRDAVQRAHGDVDGIWCILTPQEGSRGWCVTTLNSVTRGRFIAWPIDSSLGAVRQLKKTGGHHYIYICNRYTSSRVTLAPDPLTRRSTDARPHAAPLGRRPVWHPPGDLAGWCQPLGRSAKSLNGSVTAFPCV